MTKSELMVKVSHVADDTFDPLDLIKLSEELWNDAFSMHDAETQAYLWNYYASGLEKEARVGPAIAKLIRGTARGVEAIGKGAKKGVKKLLVKQPPAKKAVSPLDVMAGKTIVRSREMQRKIRAGGTRGAMTRSQRLGFKEMM